MFVRLFDNPRLFSEDGTGEFYLVLPGRSSLDAIALDDAWKNTDLLANFVFAAGGTGLTKETSEQFVEAVLARVVRSGAVRGFLWLREPGAWRIGLDGQSAPMIGMNAGATRISTGLDAAILPGARITVANTSALTLEGTEVRVDGDINFIGARAPDMKNKAFDKFLHLAGDHRGTIGFKTYLYRASLLNKACWGFQFLFPAPLGSAWPSRCEYLPLAEETPVDAIGFQATIDPSDPANTVRSTDGTRSVRSILAFTGTDDLGKPIVLRSSFRTTTGKRVDLTPLTNQPLPAALVFNGGLKMSETDEGSQLAPMGTFALSTVAPAPVALLCGLQGMECLAFDPSRDRIRFTPYCAAYAPDFPFPEASYETPPVDPTVPLLNEQYTTSWAAIVAGEGGKPAYLSQPQGSPLFGPPPAGTSGNTGVIPPLATPSVLPQSPPLPLPMAPYAGVSNVAPPFDAGAIGAFESQILSAERKRLLGVISRARVAEAKTARRRDRPVPRADDPDVRQATTPQGLYAEIAIPDPDAAEALYDKVVIARSNDKAGHTVDFGFIDLEAPLQDLFQTNQLMAVIVDPAHLGAPDAAAQGPRFDRDVVIADWRMTAAIGETAPTSGYSNILLLKYCEGSLLDRVKNPNKWVGVGDFSLPGAGDPAVELAGMSTYLQDYLQRGIDAAASGNTLFNNFARIVQDPEWNGFLVLRAKVDPSGFPDQIKGLVAGIDFTRFEAHHFGATASRVTVEGSVVKMQVPSSLFALIDYELPAYVRNVASNGPPDMPVWIPDTGDVGFHVLQLQALFENAALTDFRSRIQLTTNKLFGSTVDKAFGTIGLLPANAVVLRGSYQRQGATAVYVFEQNTDTIFALHSNILPAVAITRVVFNTLSNGDSDGIIRSRFLFWGAFEFAVLDMERPDKSRVATDLFSFGPQVTDPINGPPKGLFFSGLEIALSSPVDVPGAVTFVFESGGIALDAGASKARAHSLYADLALEVDGFIAGAEDKRPIDFGFLPVSVEPKVKPLSGPWYGITYKVTMGSPGALVSSAGFNSRMLLAWAPTSGPTDPTAAAFAGLQLPGAAPGAKLLSIQGMLKLSIDSLILRREEVVKGRDAAFVLRLSNIALAFLGIVKLPSDPINFFLFGDPSGSGSLGWYAAYIEDKQKAVEHTEPGQRAAQLIEPSNSITAERSIP